MKAAASAGPVSRVEPPALTIVRACCSGMPYGRAAGRASAVRKATRFALAGLRFDNGVASYLGVLYAENELFDAELSAVRARAERYAELINVYKAFGGGWLDLADLLAAPDRPAAGAAATQSVASPARAP